MDDANKNWKKLVDKGYRIEVKGAQSRARIDKKMWTLLPPPESKPQFPDGYGPKPEHELIARHIERTVLWKEGKDYVRQDIVDILYELKPEWVR